MRIRFFAWISFVVIAVTGFGALAGEGLDHFITARDGKLFDGTNEFRFLSFNVPNLLEIEDNVGFTNENPWRLPDQFEISDALESIRALGGTVARTYVITVRRTNDTPEIPRHVLAPGKFDEPSFRALDEVIATANRTGVRLIIPLVDNWPWMGGRAEYARWRGKTADEFWTDPQLIADFEQTIHFILTRTNTITGQRYCDDKAILCWETGNEIPSPPAWTQEIAHFIKSLDTNHLVMDGFNASVLRDESLKIPEVDIVTTHHYPGQEKSFADSIRENAAHAKGKKAYIVGEFGFVSTGQMIAAVDAIQDNGASGGLLWSLRFRDRDGGFYWHSEPFGGNLYKAFHWPASPLGKPYDEEKLLNAVREKDFAIRNLPAPKVPVPASPKLLPIPDAAAISWQGSVGAKSYQVERAAEEKQNLNLPGGSAHKIGGNWTIVSTNADEAFTQYRPQFADENVPAGRWYYRVRAKNESGVSEPSNVVGPVEVKSATVVDELGDLTKIKSHSGDWQIVNRDCRSAKEDAQRAAGMSGDAMIYDLPAAIESFRVFALFPNSESDPKFSVSDDGKNFRPIPVRKESYFRGAGEYGYWKPVLFHAEKIHTGKFLKIELTGETQIGRVEISHPALPQ